MSKQPFRIAVFASGSGSNFQAIVDDLKARPTPNIEICLLVCDRAGAKVIERAKAAGIKTYAFRAKDYATRKLSEQAILEQLQLERIDLIVLAGYMRLITDVLLTPYMNRIINIHPSLLPSFPGTRGIEDALNYGVKYTGVTVHFVDGGMDTGPIIAQAVVSIDEDETLDTLAEKIHAEEHRLLPAVIRSIECGAIYLDGRIVKRRNG